MAASFKRVIHWFRRDLRLTDNSALFAAHRQSEEVIPVYVTSPWTDSHRWTGAGRQEFLAGNLLSLSQNLQAVGGRLIVRRGQAVRELMRLAKEAKAEAIFFNRDLDPYGQAMEETLAAQCQEMGIQCLGFKDHILHEAGEILTQSGTPFRVYSPYAKVWRSSPKATPLGKVKALKTPAKLKSDPVPTLETWGMKPSGVELPKPGERAARQRLKKAVDQILPGYRSTRNTPYGDTTSRLGQDLRYGLLSIRDVYQKCLRAAEGAPTAEARTGIDTFVGELAWREFYADILKQWPEVLEEEFNPTWRGLPWEDGEKDGHFERWCQGETGFPIVDAGMRELVKTGFMHNRVRMITAMFLTKDLRIDWRRGERFFLNHLLDGEIGSNNGGWQWSSGTGADAAPYFRIQNPWTQTKSYAADGRYIQEWVPELEGADPKLLYTVPKDDGPVWPGYVAPMVNHSEERQRTLDMFARHKALQTTLSS